jgi:hypothetical protein
VLKHVNQLVRSNGIELFFHIKLEKKRWHFLLVHSLTKFLTYKKLLWTLIFLMKELWALEMSLFMWGASLAAIILKISFAIA